MRHGEKMSTQLNLIPAPRSIEMSSGEVLLSSRIVIVASRKAERAAQHLRKLFQNGPETSVMVVPDPGSDTFLTERTDLPHASFVRMEDARLDEESYHLEISDTGIAIAASESGFLSAVQTLRQLLPPEWENPTNSNPSQAVLPIVTIDDSPRFRWRGLHLDVSRHFFTVDDIKRTLDLLALYKFNRFHWHLTDDQGWRIQINSHPELTSIGAWRTEKDGSRYGGFYTQEDVRDVVAYAAERGISVLPEIEMPGHGLAALAAFPQLSCRKKALTIWSGGGIAEDVFCAGREETFALVFDVLDEIATLFPFPLIHIGGDECPKNRWKECPDCQTRIQTEGLQDESELQSYFIRRVEKHLEPLGKSIVGWDEILEGGLAPGATVMSWRGVEGGIAAARADHNVVMSPTSHCYFDYRQSGNPGEPGPTHFDPPVTRLRDVYEFEPVPALLEPEHAKRILGGQANLWTEDVDSMERVEYMLFPRLEALAEVLWSPRSLRDWDSFKNRLAFHAQRLEHLSVNYCHIIESV